MGKPKLGWKEYFRKYRKENPHYVERSRIRSRKYAKLHHNKNKEKHKTINISIKKSLKCSNCGFDDFRALQFHHRNPKEKKFNVSTAIGKGYGYDKIMTEIEKCDVLCANCHSILEYEKKQNGKLAEHG